jgi:hypothetical protein
MKRAMVTAILSLALTAAAGARDYSYLEPPTLAVVDFEVSMSSARNEAAKTFYGQLFSQALLSVLVQQNAVGQAAFPRKFSAAPGALIHDSGAELRQAGGAVPWARADAQAALEVRSYFPPIFKIYDKKYVELALQNNNFTTKDLYTKNAAAFAFPDLDYVVLGNVYETRTEAGKEAVGFNARVLSTRRAEELWAYAAVVNGDLRDLPTAAARVAALIMRDILNSQCAQFEIVAPDLFDVKAADAAVQPPAGRAITAPAQKPRYRQDDYALFWQSRQVRREDGTVDDSNHSDKRRVDWDTFYWVLPGQYVVSVYDRVTHQLRAIPFTVSAGDIKYVSVEKQHLERDKGSITIAGVLPNESYSFELKPQRQREQYWWDIGARRDDRKRITVDFDSGNDPVTSLDDVETTPKRYQENPDLVKAEYRAATNEIFIRNMDLSAYDLTIAVKPPERGSDITGYLRVSARLSARSAPLTVDLNAQKDARLTVTDFKLPERKTVDAPRKTKVTFLMNPAFEDYRTWLEVTDGSFEGWTWWRNKEKVTVEVEYSQAEVDAQPTVTYYLRPQKPFAGVSDLVVWYSFPKADLEPGRDTVVVVDFNDRARGFLARQEAERALAAASAQPGEPAPSPEAVPASPQDVGAAKARADKAAAAKKAAAAAPPGGMLLQVGGSVGYASSSYYTQSGSFPNYYTTSHSSGGVDVGGTMALLWHLTPDFALGFGALLHYAMTGDSNSSDIIAGAATLNVGVGSLKDGIIFLADIGAGTGITVGVGVGFLGPGGGLTLRAGFMYDWATGNDLYISSGSNTGNHPGSAYSATLNMGFALGL